MAVLALDIRSRQSFASGRAFGSVGAYEQLDGTMTFAVDPAGPANAAITDLDRAPRDDQGRVRFSADFCLLQPVDPGRGNRRLLSDVLNRGRKVAPRMFNRVPGSEPPRPEVEPGDGFLLDRGWTLAWCGWQWDVVPTPGLMGFDAPTALEQGRPITGPVVCEFQPNEVMADHLLADRVHLPYRAANADDPAATLTVRDWAGGPRREIPRGQWRFARDVGGQPVASDTHIWLTGAFQPGLVYEVIYRTEVCPVVGTGLLAFRDAASFLRNLSDPRLNPAAGRIDHSYAFGVSQSGRFLRQFLHLGLNLDEAGQRVFDGIHIHVAGARRGEFNQRFGQPSAQVSRGETLSPPFDWDGLLKRQRELGGVPKVIATNTSAEYWRGDGSLVHISSDGAADLPDTGEVRTYLFAGTQHTPGVVPLINLNEVEGTRGAHGFNAVDYTPLMRAALVNLDRWVAAGVEPPASSVPRLSDGTAITRSQALERFRGFTSTTIPSSGLLPGAAHDVARVSAVDADGNETAGICLPDLAVPLASYTGWNPRHAETGGPGQIIGLQGSTLPFARTAPERAATGDPRPSVEERYPSREAFFQEVRIAGQRLIDERFLLSEDLSLLKALATERFNTFTEVPVTPTQA